MCDCYLHEEQEDFEQEVQPPPPCDEVNFPLLFEPKIENFFTTFFPPHAGQDTLTEAPLTNRSNSLPQRPQPNSKMGTAAPYRIYAPAGGIDRASARNFSMPTSVSGWRTICSSTVNGTVAMWAPRAAACTTCNVERTLATMIWAAKS